jgi:HK97 family phage major capsid protein
MPTSNELRQKRTKIIADARALLAEIEGETDPKELADLEKRHDALLAELDKVDAQLARHDKLETQERLDATYRAGQRDGSDEQRRAAMRPRPGDGTARAADDGGIYVGARAGWSDKKGAEVRVLSRGQAFATDEYEGPGLGDCLRAMITGPRNDAEKRALEEGTTSAGGFTVPTPLAAIYIDKLRAASVVMQAGAQTVDMTSETLSIARLATDPTFAWRAESDEISASDPTFERVLFEAKSLAALVKVSRELLDDSVNVGAMLENAFIQAAAVAFDAAALYGASGGDNPVGVALTSGINSVDMGNDGAALNGYDDIIDALYELELDNAPAPTAMALHPRTNRDFRKQKDGNGDPLRWPTDVASIPRLPTTAVPINETQGASNAASSIILGHFPHLMIGLRSSLRIEVLRERYGEFLQFGFVAHMRGDVQLAHKASFCRIKGIIATPA